MNLPRICGEESYTGVQFFRSVELLGRIARPATHLLQRLLLQWRAFDLIIQVVHVGTVVFSPVEIKCILRGTAQVLGQNIDNNIDRLQPFPKIRTGALSGRGPFAGD